MAKSFNSELHVYQTYYGKPRKAAVRTRPAILRPNNSESEDDCSDGKIKKGFLQFEDGSEKGENFLGPNGEIGDARQVSDEKSKRVKTEKNSLFSAKFTKNYGGAMKGITYLGGKNSVIDVVEERRKLLSLFREQIESLKNRKEELTKRVDVMAYDVLKKSGNLFLTHRAFGPVPGVEVGEKFCYRLELVIMNIHCQTLRGIDYKEMPGGRVLATSIVATEGYGDNLMKPEELVYTGEGGTLGAGSKGAKDQELKGGNLALKNSVKERNFVRVVRGIRTRKNDVKSATTFVYDGLYRVVDCGKELGVNGNMLFKFKLERCSGQKTIAWEMYK